MYSVFSGCVFLVLQGPMCLYNSFSRFRWVLLLGIHFGAWTLYGLRTTNLLQYVSRLMAQTNFEQRLQRRPV